MKIKYFVKDKIIKIMCDSLYNIWKYFIYALSLGKLLNNKDC
jgi:hypothetical protein